MVLHNNVRSEGGGRYSLPRPLSGKAKEAMAGSEYSGVPYISEQASKDNLKEDEMLSIEGREGLGVLAAQIEEDCSRKDCHLTAQYYGGCNSWLVVLVWMSQGERMRESISKQCKMHIFAVPSSGFVCREAVSV